MTHTLIQWMITTVGYSKRYPNIYSLSDFDFRSTSNWGIWVSYKDSCSNLASNYKKAGSSVRRSKGTCPALLRPPISILVNLQHWSSNSQTQLGYTFLLIIYLNDVSLQNESKFIITKFRLTQSEQYAGDDTDKIKHYYKPGLKRLISN